MPSPHSAVHAVHPMHPNRRRFLNLLQAGTAGALLNAHAPGWAQAVAQRASSVRDRVLILVELKGGNDGLNTVVPFADPAYHPLRSNIAIGPQEVLRLDGKTGLHPALAPIMPLWEKNELAVVQGLGYPQANLSHFRSIEIWESASNATEYLQQGWVDRALKNGLSAQGPFGTEGVVIGASDLGPLAGARAVLLNNPQAFVNQAQRNNLGTSPATNPAANMPTNVATNQMPSIPNGNAALQHVLRVESDIGSAAQSLQGEPHAFTTVFPQHPFGNRVRVAAQVVASQKNRGGVPVIILSLGSFDTHQNQLATHANLLRQLAEGLAALHSALQEINAWDRTLVMTYSEFGRRARQNQSGGTDHGTAAPHFVTGGVVRGGLYGKAPDLNLLDSQQNLVHSLDFRSLYATVASQWWGVAPAPVVRGQFDLIPFLKGFA